MSTECKEVCDWLQGSQAQKITGEVSLAKPTAPRTKETWENKPL
jgi:hypothetical protein